MPDAINDALVYGECQICGLRGIVGMNCEDPDCHGTVVALQGDKDKNDSESDRYEDGLIDNDQVVSFDDLAEEEADEPSTSEL